MDRSRFGEHDPSREPTAPQGPPQVDPAGPQPPDQIIGTPEEDATVWDGAQSYDDTCAIRAQEFILEQFTGQEVSEDALIQQAMENGWYQPGRGGTSPEDVGKLLEQQGVPVNKYEDASPFDLANELAQGHKVIVGLDSRELIGEKPQILQDVVANTDVEADHAVVVSGVDTTDPLNPQVIISDPGSGEVASTYPMDQFLAAWQDSNFFITATQEPAPSTLPEMVNFDYDTGHIPEVVGIPYDEFVDMRDQLEEWTELLNSVAPPPPPPSEPAPLIPDQPPPEPGAGPFDDAPPLTPESLNPALFDPNAPGPTLSPELFDPASPGPTIDPSLLDPALPGPTLDPSLLDPASPGPTLSPERLDPASPGPTLDPKVLDPSSPGPTCDPSLCDPASPGPTIDPSLLDPASPGPTLDPSLLDPASPGPTLDPKVLDPSSPGPTINPSLLDPTAPGPTVDLNLPDGTPINPPPVVTSPPPPPDGGDRRVSGVDNDDVFDTDPLEP